jgi:MerR family transcriptional regulator, light-induced transcriptional regulator
VDRTRLSRTVQDGAPIKRGPYAVGVRSDAYVEIGVFSRRVGVSAELLRAWERRYGLPKPTRTANGRRLYSHADEEIVRAMRRSLARGLPAAEAARLAAAAGRDGNGDGDGAAAASELHAIAARLSDALTALDDACAHEELDRLFGAFSTDMALSEVVLPLMAELGERWAHAEIGVGDEHFASNLIHGRLLSLARKWDEGGGPRALLACPSGELHTIGLLCFGLALRNQGWRITYLGADTPVAAIAQVADAVEPAQIVLASVDPDVYRRLDDQLADLASRARVAIAGRGATHGLADALGAELLDADPVSVAAAIA